MNKKRKTTTKAPQKSIEGAPPTSSRAGADGNLGKGIFRCPVELQTEILGYFCPVGTTAHLRRAQYEPVLHHMYLERTDALRSLSQVSLDYRRVFLPLLYETLNACCDERSGSKASFYKHVGDALRKKSKGLLANPELAHCVRNLNVVLTRFQAAEIIPLFVSALKACQNLHTLHLLHIHSQMAKALKEAFEGVTLPSVRLLVIPGHGHDILRACRNVKSVWNCMWGGASGKSYRDAHYIVKVVVEHCRDVEEIRGFTYEEKTLKLLAKAVPDLKTFGLCAAVFDNASTTPLLKYLTSLPNLCELVLRVDREPGEDLTKSQEEQVKKAKAFLKGLPPRASSKSLRLWNVQTQEWKLSYTSVDLEN